MVTIAATQRSLTRKIIFLSLAGFLLVIIAGAYHYNDKTFLLRSRSVGKISTFTGTMGKYKIGSVPAASVVSLESVAFCPLLTDVIPETRTIFLSSQIAYIYPNKAPPARS